MAVTGRERTAYGLRWLSLGRSERAAWGRCQGSAAEPYRTVVSAHRPSITSCSCPSRRRPCKHALGLGELAADGQIAVADEPAWVVALVSRRPFTEPAPDPDQTGDQPGGTAGPVDPVAAAKRAEARHAKVSAGLAELQVWLADQVRIGLAGLPRAGYAHVDAIAARMVDAQAPGVAGTLRALPADLVSADWPDRVLQVLGGLHLLAQAYGRIDRLDPELAATVRSRIGYPVTREQVRARPAVPDRWWALAAVEEVEYQLTTRRVWLRGLDTGRWAMCLTFAPPGRELDTSMRPGRVYACNAHFYPGSGQHRALIEPPLHEVDDRDPGDPDETLGRTWAGDDWAAIRRQLAAVLTGDPWAGRLPVVVTGVPLPPRGSAGWQLRDPAGETVPLVGLDGDPWPLVAQSGGEPLQLMGEYDGRGLLPLAVLTDERGRRHSTVVTG